MAISTQFVFETLAELGRVPRETCWEIGAKLVGWRYVDTRVMPESFLSAARLAKWDAALWPLEQHMELLGRAPWPEVPTAFFIAEVFRLWWNACLDRTAMDTLIVAVLVRLVGRPNGQRLCAMLLHAVPARFGLDVLGSRHVVEVMITWLRTQPG